MAIFGFQMASLKGSLTLFGPLSGAFFWERCLELRIGYFMAFCGWSALVCNSSHLPKRFKH